MSFEIEDEEPRMSTLDGTGMIKTEWQPDHGAFHLYKRLDGTKPSYWIKFAGNHLYLEDPKGPSRGPPGFTIRYGHLLKSETIDPILKALRHVYPAIFQPKELVYTPAAGIPAFDSNDKLATKRGFKPETHQVILRIIHSPANNHWSLLVHFISIETILLWDPLESEKFVTREEGGLAPYDCETLNHHARWVEGTIAQANYSNGTRWRVQKRLGEGLQNTDIDEWSCGLFALSRLEDVYRTMNERLSVDAEINYEEVVASVILQSEGKKIAEQDLLLANSRVQLAHSLGYEIKYKRGRAVKGRME